MRAFFEVVQELHDIADSWRIEDWQKRSEHTLRERELIVAHEVVRLDLKALTPQERAELGMALDVFVSFADSIPATEICTSIRKRL